MGDGPADTAAAGGLYPETTWSLVCGLRDSTPEARRPGMEKLARRYWRPVFRTVRVIGGRDEAEDLTQAFFTWLLERDTLTRYLPERGTFRAYLKGILRRFLADRRRESRALKRGGGAEVFPLHDEMSRLADTLADPDSADPEEVFDRAWRTEIADAALARVRARYAPDDVRFAVFEAYDLSEDEARPTYAGVAARLGISESDVRNHLFAVRERLRDEVRAELAETVSDPAGLDEEWADLFRG